LEDVKRTLFLTDTHDPFRDPRAHDLTCQLIEAIKPDTIVLGSDGLDCYKLSKFDKSPARKETLQDEIDVWLNYTREWKQAAGDDCKLVWIPGNHEDRLRRCIWANPGLYGLRVLTWANLLKFEELGISRPKNDEYLVNDRIVIKHGASALQHSTRSGWKELNREAFSITTITGHCHRMGFAVKRTRRGLVACYEGACLCKLEAEYAGNVDWHQGITLIEHGPGSNLFRVDPILYVPTDGKTRVLWQGKEYVA
jgi:predicted phosphodiesterase